MTAPDKVVCGKRKYHDFVFGDDEHGAWIRQSQRTKAQCGHIIVLRPTLQGPVYVDHEGNRYLDYYSARNGMAQRMAPLPRRARTPAACGTVAGYARHIRRKETTCQACRDAHARNQRRLKWGG